MRLKSAITVSVVAAAMGLSACGEAPKNGISEPLTATEFEVRLNPAPGRPAAGYGLIVGQAGFGIMGVSSPEAGRIEMHIMEKSGEAMRMKKVDMLTIDSDGTLRFQSGGRHLMIFDIAGDAADDGAMQIDFKLEDGTTLVTFADVKR